MESFRYPHFCPLARAAEVLGNRWVLPILREVFVGPQRFSDLRRRLGNVSPSVLSQRLGVLERQGVLARRELPAPAASVVYELTARGQALEPVMMELIRWGTLLLATPLSGEHFEPDWMGLAARAFARSGPTPRLSFELRVVGPGRPEALVQGHGGPGGTVIGPADEGLAQLRVRAPALLLLAFLSGGLPPEAFSNHPDVVVEGDTARIAELPELFDVPNEASSLHATPESPTQEGVPL